MASSGLDTLLHSAVARFGPGACRTAGPGDSIAGQLPAFVAEPADVAMLTDMLRWANLDRVPLAPRGAGTKLAWGRPPSRAVAALSTARLGVSIEHTAGDLTAIVSSGTTLAGLNAALAREGQWLPLDPRFGERATIGGIVATNDSGPRRHKHGAPRDLIIGAEMALADGRTVKAGGRVVKNVAGYDLARMLCGSFGTLAVITRAIFKLAPVPPASRTVVATSRQAGTLADLSLAFLSSPLTPSAIELDSSTAHRLLIRFETTDAAAIQQASAAEAVCRSRGIDASIVSGDVEAEAWVEHLANLSSGDGTVIRVAVLPAQVKDFLGHLERVMAQGSLAWSVAGRVALGVLYVRVGSGGAQPTAPEAVCSAVDALRQNAWARGGSAVVVAAEPPVAERLDPWGDVGDAAPLMRAVKARFDPNGILNPGRGPGNI
jgi:glycolate oxidase FAD binding subunit